MSSENLNPLWMTQGLKKSDGLISYFMKYRNYRFNTMKDERVQALLESMSRVKSSSPSIRPEPQKLHGNGDHQREIVDL